MSNAKTTYTWVARDPNSWSPSTGIHQVTWDCGHKHRSFRTAERCSEAATGNRDDCSPNGWYPAHLHHARIESSKLEKFYALGYHDAKTGQEQTCEDCWEANAYGEGYTDALKEEAGQ